MVFIVTEKTLFSRCHVLKQHNMQCKDRCVPSLFGSTVSCLKLSLTENYWVQYLQGKVSSISISIICSNNSTYSPVQVLDSVETFGSGGGGVGTFATSITCTDSDCESNDWSPGECENTDQVGIVCNRNYGKFFHQTGVLILDVSL